MNRRNPKQALADFIRAARGKDLDQKAFAERLGVSPAYVSKLESGDATPGPELLLVLSKEFGVDADRARRLLLAVHEAESGERWARAATRLGMA